MKNPLYLGIQKEKITPKVGAQLYGYRPDTISTSVHDDLYVTTFYLKQGDVEALLVSFDLCLMKTAIADELRLYVEENYGIPKGNCLLSTTHTHSGPNVAGQTGWGAIDADYYNNVFRPAFISTVEQAIKKAVPVKIGVASGDSSIGINRRELCPDNKIALGQNPWGPYNPKMTVISFVDESGVPIANMVHYGMHGTCAGRNFEISRDWCGVMIDELEAISGATSAFFNGPEGDVGPRLTNGRTTGVSDVRYVERHGALAADDAVRIYKTIKAYSDAELSVLSATVDIPLERRPSLETIRSEYEKIKNETVSLLGAKAEYYRDQMKLYEDGYEDVSVRTIPQSIVRIGDVAFVSTPFEMFSVVGMRIAAQSKIQHTLTLSNTNGSEGYFVTEDQICRGGYEVNMFKFGYIQPYADDADWHFLSETVKNLEKLY